MWLSNEPKKWLDNWHRDDPVWNNHYQRQVYLIHVSESLKHSSDYPIEKFVLSLSIDHRYITNSTFTFSNIQYVNWTLSNFNMWRPSSKVIRSKDASDVHASYRSTDMLHSFSFVSIDDCIAKYVSSRLLMRWFFDDFRFLLSLVREVMHLVLQAKPGGLKSDQLETKLIEMVHLQLDLHKASMIESFLSINLSRYQA